LHPNALSQLQQTFIADGSGDSILKSRQPLLVVEYLDSFFLCRRNDRIDNHRRVQFVPAPSDQMRSKLILDGIF
jgi:hypothetical protein